jgi:ATP-dependent DNA ligase
MPPLPSSPHAFRPRRSPMLPLGPGWLHEIKHDGYRLQVHIRDKVLDATF